MIEDKSQPPDDDWFWCDACQRTIPLDHLGQEENDRCFCINCWKEIKKERSEEE